VRNGNKTIVAQSIAVQDIEKYTARDQKRPYRDAKVGMLPPKLAQTIINLAVGPFERELVCNTPVAPAGRQSKTSTTVLDPFCGSGVILQEASLMDLDAYGTDLSPLMVDYSAKNLKWLENNFRYYNKKPKFEAADATSYKWPHSFDTIATEAYLGKPLSSQPSADLLDKISIECDLIIEKFLKNLASQTKPGFRLCVAIPAWKINKGFLHLRTLDKLSDLGYNRLKFVHVSNDELIYHRPDQIVARELVVLERK
jgi:tRNA G10  N-methylase Trm11